MWYENYNLIKYNILYLNFGVIVRIRNRVV